MSAEAQNTDKSIEKISLNLFRKHKVAISHKIKDSFPFFELLHDHDFITSEMYDVSKETFKKGHRIEEVVYKVLTEAQKKFKPSLLKILFDEFTLKRNPDLNHIYEIFKNEIPDKNFFSENDAQENEERPDTQSQFEQAPHDKELSEKLSEIEEIIAMETGITSNNNDALESQQANEQRAQQCDPAGAELHNHGIPVNSCPIVPVDIMKKKSFFSSEVEWEAQAKSGCNKESDIIEISSEDSMERRNREAFHPEASASALKRKSGIVDSENSSTSEKTKRKRKSGRHKEDNVDVKAEILPVTCGDMRGLLIKRKFEQGATRKCIRTEDGTWLTPREFEVRGGYEKASNWKTSLTCGGKTLKRLMEEEKVPTPPTTCGRNKKGGNSDKCKICLDGAKLFRCEKCQSFFHENCHLPPVDTKRNGWRCTFCTIDSLPRSQQRYRESEVLERQMEPEEKLKCAFLFLKVYSPLENDIFLKIPHENYVENASQCLERLRMLDKIRKSLNEGDYTKVKSFVQAIHPLFQDPKCNNSDLTEEEFKKNFKEVFAIQETN
ncbi:nuclear body protein SP140-like protein isoform X2 [Artibeus jamaicensis]|uniref:nuclear body protein SP140-like protein isoform X2 n=1 Tax=Artibeus jamaicensis TaxID=9417 RepID=UPI00235ADF12|nr:nuclear body protein SP140-like protein isoform X2 [Artibeus jamaicensis]